MLQFNLWFPISFFTIQFPICSDNCPTNSFTVITNILFLFSNGIIGKPGSKFQIPARVLCPQSPEVKSNFVSLHISMDKCVNKFGNIFVFCLLNMTKIKQFIPKNKTNLGINYFEGSEY